MLNDTRESLGKVSRNQCKLTISICPNILNYSTCTCNCALGIWIHSKPWSLQLPVYELYFHGNLKMLKPNIQLQRSAFTKKLYKWGKFLPQRTASIRHEEDYLHKKNLEMFLLKIGVRREGRLPCSFHTCSWKPMTNVDKPPFVKQVTITLPSS